MLDLIARIGSKLGMDVVLCSHLLEEVERVADAVVILDSGRVVKQGQMGDLAGAESELVINLDGPGLAPKVIARLKRRKVEAREENGELVVVLKGDATYDSVRDALASAGAGVRRMGRRRLRLEDVFFEERGVEASVAASRPNGAAK
jgi:ABC-2 type transport system ATP-binding protein